MPVLSTSNQPPSNPNRHDAAFFLKPFAQRSLESPGLKSALEKMWYMMQRDPTVEHGGYGLKSDPTYSHFQFGTERDAAHMPPGDEDFFTDPSIPMDDKMFLHNHPRTDPEWNEHPEELLGQFDYTVAPSSGDLLRPRLYEPGLESFVLGHDRKGSPILESIKNKNKRMTEDERFIYDDEIHTLREDFTKEKFPEWDEEFPFPFMELKDPSAQYRAWIAKEAEKDEWDYTLSSPDDKLIENILRYMK
jgi:hypothetical protein|tara:strand:+ start:9171 stop:9911 length:741 start_codon:yes stop_codon:yes gene_type:complete